MIAWSKNKLSITLGIGVICIVFLLMDVSSETIPLWLAIAAAILPLVVFLFIQPGEMRRSIVLPLQVFASLWYLLLALILFIMLFVRGETEDWPVFFFGLAAGSIPCVVVLKKVLCRGRPGDHSQASASFQAKALKNKSGE